MMWCFLITKVINYWGLDYWEQLMLKWWGGRTGSVSYLLMPYYLFVNGVGSEKSPGLMSKDQDLEIMGTSISITTASLQILFTNQYTFPVIMFKSSSGTNHVLNKHLAPGQWPICDYLRVLQNVEFFSKVFVISTLSLLRYGVDEIVWRYLRP